MRRVEPFAVRMAAWLAVLAAWAVLMLVAGGAIYRAVTP